jgi:hypothetical protein
MIWPLAGSSLWREIRFADAWEMGQQAILEYLQKHSLEDFITQNPPGRFPPRG